MSNNDWRSMLNEYYNQNNSSNTTSVDDWNKFKEKKVLNSLPIDAVLPKQNSNISTQNKWINVSQDKDYNRDVLNKNIPNYMDTVDYNRDILSNQIPTAYKNVFQKAYDQAYKEVYDPSSPYYNDWVPDWFQLPIRTAGAVVTNFAPTKRILQAANEALGVPMKDVFGNEVKKETTGSGIVDKALDLGGNLAGLSMIGPGSDVNALNFSDDAAKAISDKVASKIANKPLVSSLIKNAALNKGVKKAEDVLTNSIIPGFTRGATDAGLGTAVQDIGEGRDLKTTAKDVLTNAAFGGGLFAAGKGVFNAIGGKYKTKIEPESKPIDIIPSEEVAATKQPIQGKFKVKNTQLENAMKAWDDFATYAQNKYGHYQLTDDEILNAAIEKGVDPFKLIDDMQQASKGISEANIPSIYQTTYRNKMAKASGVDLGIPKLQKPESIKKTAPLEQILPDKKVVSSGNGLNPLDNTNPNLTKESYNTSEPGLKESKLPKSFDNSEFINDEVKSKLADSPERTYEQDSNTRQWNDATDAVKNDFNGTLTRLTSKQAFDSADDVAQGFAVIDELQKRGNYDAAADFAESMIPKSRKLGQAVQAHAIVGRLSPEGVLRFAAKQYDKANQFLTEGKKIKLTGEKSKALVDAAKDIQSMPKGRLKDLAEAKLVKNIYDDVPISVAKKLSTVQAMSQLLNIKTVLRNIFGNTGFNLAETVSNLYAKPFDLGVSIKTGEKTISGPTPKIFAKNFIKGAKNSIEEIKMGVDLNNYDKYNVSSARVFKDPILGNIEKAMNYTLKTPDEAFKKAIYESSLSQQMKAAGVTTATEKMIKQAEREAAYRTFQDDSLPAQILQGAKDLFNKVGFGKKQRGPSGLITKEFGAGDLIIKYTKVPGNIISRTVEYSPLGYLKMLSVLREAKISGVLNQRELSLTFGRATNGSLMIGMGALLNRMGLLKSEDKDMDKDAKELDRAAGLGTYKLNVSAVDRIINGGKLTPQELKPGDTLASYNWMQPVSTAFAIGAAIDNELNKTGEKTNIVNRVGSVALEETLDIPTLTIIQQMFYESQKKDSTAFDIVTVPFKQAVPGFIPSQLRQIAQTTDPIYRNAKSDDTKQTFINGLKADIPGLSKDLLPKITPTGKEKQNQLPLINLFSPAQITKYQPEEITSKLKELEKASGDTTFYPRSTAPKSFMYKKQPIVLTESEKTEWQKQVGQETNDMYKEILKGYDIKDLTEDGRKHLISLLNNAIDKANERAKTKVLESRGIK